MKIRESGMPEREMWENFFDPVKTLATLGISSQTGDVVEFGCGYGTFTIPTATVIKGKVYALDMCYATIIITGPVASDQNVTIILVVFQRLFEFLFTASRFCSQRLRHR